MNRGFSLAVALISALALTVPAKAAEKIEGGFGLKLGEKFEPTSDTPKMDMQDGTPAYRFKTEKGFRSFTHYYVRITPTTHQIYGIFAFGRAENTERGKKEQALVMELLSQKYGEVETVTGMAVMHHTLAIKQENRYVMTRVTGFSPVLVEIHYHDEELQKLAERERLAIEGKKTDASGL